MQDGIFKRFLNRCVRVVEHALCLGASCLLCDLLPDDIVPDIAQCIVKLAVKGAIEDLFSHAYARGIRLVYHFNAGIAEEIVRALVEEHQAGINGLLLSS